MPASRPTLAHRTPAPRRRAAATAAAVALVAALAAAPSPVVAAEEEVVTVKAAPLRIAAGSEATLRITITIAPGYHLLAAPPPNRYMTPVTLLLPAADGLAPLGPVYPEPTKVTEEGFEYPAYEGKLTVTLPIKAMKDAAPGPHVLKGTLRHQAIRVGQFMKLKVLPVEFAIEVTAAKKTGKPAAPATRP